MERAYAQALWNAIERGTEASSAVKALHTILEKAGRVSLMPRIGKAFARLAAQDMARTQVTLTVADKSHEHIAIQEALARGAELQLTAKDIKTHVDKTIIGGWRLEGNEHLLDASYKKHLLAMYQKAAQF